MKKIYIASDDAVQAGYIGENLGQAKIALKNAVDAEDRKFQDACETASESLKKIADKQAGLSFCREEMDEILLDIQKAIYLYFLGKSEPPTAVDYISDVDADCNPCKPKPIGIIVKMENGARYYHWYE